MPQNTELRHTTVEELETISWNEGGTILIKNIYKYTSNISVIDPY